MASEYPNTTSELFSLAQQALNDARSTRSMLWSSYGSKISVRTTDFDHDVGQHEMAAPPRFSDMFEGADTTNSQIVRLNTEADEWLNKYFPAIANQMRTIPEDWLVGVISGVKPFGMDETAFELVWHRARDRAYRGANSATRTLAEQFSARGFTLPPGAMAAALAGLEQEAARAISEVNREQAIKEAEIKLELLKFAVEQATRLKLGVMAAMADFYRMWFSLPDKDIERARIRAQAMSGFYAALSSYYNVEVAFERLRLEAAQVGAEVSLRNQQLRLQASEAGREGLGALGQAVQAFGSVASGSASAAGTLVAQIEAI